MFKNRFASNYFEKYLSFLDGNEMKHDYLSLKSHASKQVKEKKIHLSSGKRERGKQHSLVRNQEHH